MNIKFSVIITTFDVPELLVECLESFKPSDEVEILVGIDGCEKTKKLVVDLEKKKYIRFFYFTENCGTYTVRNNLIEKTQSDIILFFDSDDIASPNIFERFNPNYDITRLKFKDFGGIKNNIEVAQGVFFIKKEILNKLVGFQDWMCNADVEFRIRALKQGIKIKQDNVISFNRRKHSKNLTIKPETNMKSELRKSYENILKTKIKSKDWTNPIIKKVDYYEL